MVICLRMRKTYTAKTPPGDFLVTTPTTPLLPQLHDYHDKWLQVKESQVPYQPTVELLPQYPIGLVL